MKRYFEIHDQKVTVKLNIDDDSPASYASVSEFRKLFHSKDVRELTLSQYLGLSAQYTGSSEER